MGRSRVAVSALSEMPQSGLPMGWAAAPMTAGAAPMLAGVVAACASDAKPAPAPSNHSTATYRRMIPL